MIASDYNSLGSFLKWGNANSCMVDFRENPRKSYMDENWGVAYLWKHPYVFPQFAMENFMFIGKSQNYMAMEASVHSISMANCEV